MNNDITANIIIIGNEILSGRTKDVNINYIAKELSLLGINLTHVRIISDTEEEIIYNVNELRKKCTYLFTTGGIGPTHDDITSISIAKALGKKFIQHPEAAKILTAHYGDQINDARLSMANMPEGSIIIDNPISKAPGYQIENIFVLPGVPAICQAIFNNVIPRLNTGKIIYNRSIKAYIGEGIIAYDFANLQKKWPNVYMGSYPFNENEIYGTELVLRSDNIENLEQAFKEVELMINKLDDNISNQ